MDTTQAEVDASFGTARLGAFADKQGKLSPSRLLRQVVEAATPQQRMEIAAAMAVKAATHREWQQIEGDLGSLVGHIIRHGNPEDLVGLDGTETGAVSAYLVQFFPSDIARGIGAIEDERSNLAGVMRPDWFAEAVMRLTRALDAHLIVRYGE